METTKKYELTDEVIEVDDVELRRIRAVRNFGDVKAGDLGGFVQSEINLSHHGNARVCDDAKVCGNAWVCGNAQVFGDARVCGDARIRDSAKIQSCDDLCAFGYFGSVNRHTTAYRTTYGGIAVCCGCFYGTLEQFRKKVKKTHGTGDYAIEYLMIADLIEHKLSKRVKA